MSERRQERVAVRDQGGSPVVDYEVMSGGERGRLRLQLKPGAVVYIGEARVEVLKTSTGKRIDVSIDAPRSVVVARDDAVSPRMSSPQS